MLEIAAAVGLAPMVHWYAGDGAILYAIVLVVLVTRGVMREVAPATRELDELVTRGGEDRDPGH